MLLGNWDIRGISLSCILSDLMIYVMTVVCLSYVEVMMFQTRMIFFLLWKIFLRMLVINQLAATGFHSRDKILCKSMATSNCLGVHLFVGELFL